MSNWLKDGLKGLDTNSKLVLGGSLAMVISVFLPWYSDLDKFNTGSTFLGITGPLYLAGLLVMLSGFFSMAFIVIEILEKPVPKLPLSQKHLNIALSSLSLLMVVMSMSVYFHAKFGINLTNKSAGIGMVIASIGSFVVLGGSLMPNTKRHVLYEHDEHLKNIIDDVYIERRPQEIEHRDIRDRMNESVGSISEDVLQENNNYANDKYDRN